MNDITKKYGLSTAITMIIGICIGSGIFFKSDNILVATGGSILLGVLLFTVAAISIIFGCLTIGELAARTDKVGGLITYGEIFLSKKIGCAFGWFQTLIYFPTITSVVAWVVGIYTCILFNLGDSLSLQILIGYCFLAICFLYNSLLPKFGAIIQNSTTFVKLIPLFILGFLGLAFGDPLTGLSNIQPHHFAGSTWLAALGPIAYSFDGWIVATTISHELKDSKRNMPKALLIGPLIVLMIYLLYFIGISCYVGPETVIALNDAHVSYAASHLLGETFSKMIVIFVIISVMGTVNGLVTGYIRAPYSLAIRPGMFPFSKYLSKLNNHNMPIHSALFSFIVCSFWTLMHFICTKYNWLFNSDISEGAIVISYLFYIMLYFKVFMLYRKKEIKSFFKGVICPILATVGSFIILSGGLQNKLFIVYLIICLLLFRYSIYYYDKNK